MYEGEYEDYTRIKCEDPNSCSLNPMGTVMEGYSEKECDNLSSSRQAFMVKAADDSDSIDPTPAGFVWTILGAIADTGLYQSVKSNEVVRLDGSDSSDPEGSALTYSWIQTGDGPQDLLNDPNSISPTFTTPLVTKDSKITFQLIVIILREQKVNLAILL